MKESWANEEHIIQCFRPSTCQTRVFNMVYVGACECDRMPSHPGLLPLPSRTEVHRKSHILTNKGHKIRKYGKIWEKKVDVYILPSLKISWSWPLYRKTTGGKIGGVGFIIYISSSKDLKNIESYHLVKVPFKKYLQDTKSNKHSF